MKTYEIVAKPQPINGLGKRKNRVRVVFASTENGPEQWLRENGRTFEDDDGTLNRYVMFSIQIRSIRPGDGLQHPKHDELLVLGPNVQDDCNYALTKSRAGPDGSW